MFNSFAKGHDRMLDPPEDPFCECEDSDGDPIEHEECKNEDCPCPHHEKYNPRNEPEYNED